eukprot:8670_1
MTDSFITESTEFLEKLVYSNDRVKTLEDTFNKKSDQKDERHHFYKLLTLQTKHGFSGKKDAKALAAEIDTARRMNGNKKEGWAKESERVRNLLLRQQIIDFKSTTAPNRKKTMVEIKTLLHKNLTNDVIPPEQKEQKENKYSSSLDKQLNTAKLLKKKWDEINAKKTKDDNICNHFEPIAGWEFLCVQKMNSKQVASFLDLMKDESTRMRDNVTLLPFFKQDLEQNKTVFGTRSIHHRIIARDMELLGKNSQSLQKDEHFMEIWATKFDKVTDLNPVFNDELRSKYLQKLKKWMDQYMRGGGSPSLKALILYNLLVDQERLGKYDKEVFREYLAVPKHTAYNATINTKKKAVADLTYTINTPSLQPIIDDEALVYRYFRKLFQKKDEKVKNWTDFVDTDYVKAVLCEARLMNDASSSAGGKGKGGDLKKMYTKVRGKYAVQTLQNQVVIEIEAQNQRYYEVNDVVNLKVAVKNVNELTVNVYCMNQKNYYKQYGKEVDINMNLDGLTANHIITKQYKENSFLLRSRSIDIKELKEKRGVFLIDVLGNGKRARCLIRKGQLRYISRQEKTDDGVQYVLSVLGEQNKVITKAQITLQGTDTTYASDDKGNVFIPFARNTDILSAPIILEDVSRGPETATLQLFDYRTENYFTQTGLYLDRELLLENKTCPIFVRPNLFLNEEPVSCEILQDVSLLVKASVGGGDKKVLIKKFRINDLSDKRESVVYYNVPAELRSIELILSGKVWVGSQSKWTTLSNSSEFEVNAIDDSQAVGQCLLLPSDSKYVLKIVGKNSETLSGIKVLLKLKHKHFKQLLEYKLQSDKDGIIKLGELPDIESVEVYPENERNKTLLFDKQSFVIPRNTVNIPQTINVNHGNDVFIPLITDNIQPRCDVYDNSFIKIYENVQFNAGYLKISQLPAGDFVAMVRDTQRADVRIHVSKGIGCCGHSVAKDRIVELSESKSLQIVQTKGNRGNGYKVKLDGCNNKFTRVHAISSCGVPQFNAFDFLASPNAKPQVYAFDSYPLQYTTDRAVSDEENYIYKRRQNKPKEDEDSKEESDPRRYGNALSVPSLLLNKWTSDGTAEVKDEEAQPAAEVEEEPVQVEAKAKAKRGITYHGKSVRKESDPANLDILGFPARVAINLQPDKSGVVAIPADILEPNHNLLTIIALDDNNTSVVYERLKAVSKVPVTDTRLVNGLDPKKHFSEVRDVLLKAKGESVSFDKWPTTTLETYDDLSDIYELYYSIADETNNDAMKSDLIDFRFLAKWSDLSTADKMDKYDAFACNEFNFFLKNKDLNFFESVVSPILSNRLQKSFFDHYLLGNAEQIGKYERLDLYHTLNAVEKILLASVIGGKLTQNTIGNLTDVVSLKTNHIQEFNALFQQALLAKQYEVTTLADLQSDGSGSGSATISRQYQESRYYKIDYDKQSRDLIAPNAFWLDYANFVLNKGKDKTFLSKNFGFAASNTAEALLALSVISLPFRGSQSEPTIEIMSKSNEKLKSYEEGATVNVTVNGPTMLLVKSLQETPFASSSLAVSTNYFDPLDKFESVDFERVDKFVGANQFVSGKTYGCRIVITNVSSVTYQVDLLCQIPTGSIPVHSGFRTKNFVMKLSSYATASREYYFYFPSIGAFEHYPAHVSRNGECIGYSLNKCSVNVVDASQVFDVNSWPYITSSKPDVKDVLEHIKNSTTLRKDDLSKLAWRCGDEKFFKEITNILKRKQLYNSKIWRYALVHNCEQETAEYLLRNTKFMALLAPALTGENTGDPLFLNYNSYERNTYRHIEFFQRDENIVGLFNTRIHQNNLLNKHERFKRIYRDFMIRCLYRSCSIKTMSLDDQMCAIFYLIAQNRIKAANVVYKGIDGKAAKKSSPMMFDYVTTFLAFFEKDSKAAMERADNVHKWLSVKLPATKRKMWLALKKQLTELQVPEKTLEEFQETEVAKKQKQSQPKLNFVIDMVKKQIRIKSKNIAKIRANFYAINIEELFSNSPFTAGVDALSYVEPTISLPVAVSAEESKKKDADVLSSIEFPKGLDQKSNFVLELLGNNPQNTRVAKTQYNNTLYVEFNKKRGDVFVGNFSKFPVIQAYVKVYLATTSNPNGFFLKDGYTDLRGRFDYLATDVSLPTESTKVAVLVVSQACGANIYYVDIEK